MRKCGGGWGAECEFYGGVTTLHIANPESGIRLIWDLLLVVFLLYVAILIPARICFDVDVRPLGATFWFEVVVDVCFLSDIVLNFRTAIVEDGELYTDPGYVAKRYISRGLRSTSSRAYHSIGCLRTG